MCAYVPCYRTEYGSFLLVQHRYCEHEVPISCHWVGNGLKRRTESDSTYVSDRESQYVCIRVCMRERMRVHVCYIAHKRKNSNWMRWPSKAYDKNEPKKGERGRTVLNHSQIGEESFQLLGMHVGIFIFVRVLYCQAEFWDTKKNVPFKIDHHEKLNIYHSRKAITFW